MKDTIVKIKHAIAKKYVFDQAGEVAGEVTRDPLKDIKILLEEINTIQIREALVAKHRDKLQLELDSRNNILEKIIREANQLAEFSSYCDAYSELTKDLKIILKGTK